MIEGVLRDTLGCDPPWPLAAANLTSADTAWTPEDVMAELDEHVNRRNRIAHQGDTIATGRTASIRRDHVVDAVVLVRAVGTATQELVAEHSLG